MSATGQVLKSSNISSVVLELGNGNRKASFVRSEMRVRARHLSGKGVLGQAALTAYCRNAEAG
jgi:hypothetical protein